MDVNASSLGSSIAAAVTAGTQRALGSRPGSIAAGDCREYKLRNRRANEQLLAEKLRLDLRQVDALFLRFFASSAGTVSVPAAGRAATGKVEREVW